VDFTCVAQSFSWFEIPIPAGSTKVELVGHPSSLELRDGYISFPRFDGELMLDARFGKHDLVHASKVSMQDCIRILYSAPSKDFSHCSVDELLDDVHVTEGYVVLGTGIALSIVEAALGTQTVTKLGVAHNQTVCGIPVAAWEKLKKSSDVIDACRRIIAISFLRTGKAKLLLKAVKTAVSCSVEHSFS